MGIFFIILLSENVVQPVRSNRTSRTLPTRILIRPGSAGTSRTIGFVAARPSLGSAGVAATADACLGGVGLSHPARHHPTCTELCDWKDGYPCTRPETSCASLELDRGDTLGVGLSGRHYDLPSGTWCA